MNGRLRWLMALCLAGTSVQADVRLQGHQHIGDSQSATYTPSDPVRRERMLSFPSRFHLTQPTTITSVTFENAISLNNSIQAMVIDGVVYNGSLSGSTFTLSASVTLSAGTHSIAPDPGCLDQNNNATICTGSANQNDISFSALVLDSAQSSTSLMFNQRRNIGDDNDVNDDYEANPTELDAWYPDSSDGASVTESFELVSAAVLSEIRFYRVREIENAVGIVSVNGAQVGTLPINTSGQLHDPAVVYPALSLAAGKHSVTVEAGGTTNLDTFSWDDMILIFGSPTGGQLGSFNAVDSDQNAVSGRIRTKIAAQTESVDVVALSVSGAITDTVFSDVVAVELLDAQDDSGAFDANGCRSSWSVLQPLGTLSFDVLDAGRKTFSFAYADVLRKARLRLSSGTSVACSTDAFAIRPSSLQIQASHANSTTAGTVEVLNETTSGGTKTHRAGQAFTIQIRGRNAAGNVTTQYDGLPELSVASTIEGPISGAISANNWTNNGSGTLRTDEARYSEAGTFNLQARDAEFAIVDADDPSPNRYVVSTTTGVGRFTPDHFRLLEINTPELGSACGSFTYLGQDFSFAIEPEVEIEMVNASGARTLNYTLDSDLQKLPANASSAVTALNATSLAPVALSLAGGTDPISILSNARAQVRFGVDRLYTAPRTTPEVPHELEISLTGTITDSDGITYADPQLFPLVFGDDTVGNGLGFGAGSKSFVFGRMFIRNAYGSEIHPLTVTFGAEFYFQGGDEQYGVQTADSCTPAPTLWLTGALAASTSAVGTSGLNLGLGTTTLQAPNPVATGNLNVFVLGPAWLGADTNGDDVYSEPVTGQASFGVFRQLEEQIYLRETY